MSFDVYWHGNMLILACVSILCLRCWTSLPGCSWQRSGLGSGKKTTYQSHSGGPHIRRVGHCPVASVCHAYLIASALTGKHVDPSHLDGVLHFCHWMTLAVLAFTCPSPDAFHTSWSGCRVHIASQMQSRCCGLRVITEAIACPDLVPVYMSCSSCSCHSGPETFACLCPLAVAVSGSFGLQIQWHI